MVKDLNKATKKGANKRCPFRNQCGKACEHVGSELGCNFYKYNATGDDIIEDQERIRELMEKSRVREMEEEIIEEMEDEGGLVMLPVDVLYPHPDNPRKELGDLGELSESIKAKGIMQNLTVVPKKDAYGKYTVIIGHRRLAAAKQAGLKKVPCVVTNMSEQDQLATMLLENIQRSDLTAYEQAKGFQMMIDFGDSVAGIVDKTGFSESTVRRRLKMNELDEEVLREVSSRQISLIDMDKLYKIEDDKERTEVLRKIGTSEFNSAYSAAIGEQKRRNLLAQFEEAFDKAGLMKLSGADYSQYVYHKAISTLTDIEKEIADVKERGVVAYYHAYSTTYYMMTEKSNGKVKTKAQQEAEQKELERKRRCSTIDEAFKRAYQMRREFIDNYAMTAASKNLVKIAAYLACSAFNGDLAYEIGKEEFEKLIFGRECEISSFEELHEMLEDHAGAKALLVTAWLLTDCAADAVDYNGCYEENPVLSMLYDFLESIGYEISEEERGLITGESELYLKEE